MKITAIQIQDVLDRLPPTRAVEADSFKLAMRPSFDDYIDMKCGAEVCADSVGEFTFVKSNLGTEWILHSMPSLESQK